MKLKYTFEIMDVGDQVVAVPVGDNAGELHGIVKLNSTGAEILRLIQEGKNEAEIVDELGKKYESDKSEIQAFVAEFIGKFREAGLFE